MPWLTPADMTARLPDFDPADSGQSAAVTALIAEAEALIQSEIGDTLAPADTTPDVRVFYGDGTPHLRIDPHAGTIVTGNVVIASGAANPKFTDRGRYLSASDVNGDLWEDASSWADVWPRGQKVTVTADWGAAIPADLLTAARELVCSWYIASRVSTALELVQMRDMPPMAERALKRYKMSRGLRRAFA